MTLIAHVLNEELDRLIHEGNELLSADAPLGEQMYWLTTQDRAIFCHRAIAADGGSVQS